MRIGTWIHAERGAAMIFLILCILFGTIHSLPFHHDLSEDQIAELISFMPQWDGTSALPFEKDHFENVMAC